MTDANVSAIISAMAGLIGVAVGSLTLVLRDWVSNRRKRIYLSVRIICVLDMFVRDCAMAIDQYKQREEIPISPWPENLEFPDDLDWHLLDDKLIYRVLSLPNEVKRGLDKVLFSAEFDSTESDPQHFHIMSLNEYK